VTPALKSSLLAEPPADPLRRRHPSSLDLDRGAAAVADHDHREPPVGLHRAAKPMHLPVGGAMLLQHPGIMHPTEVGPYL
jgi:hypothetical protein